MFPNADCYTLFYDEEEMQGRYKDRITKTSFLDIPPVRRHHRAFIPLFPLASSHLRARKKYDLVLSETAGYAKGFGIKGNHHISYCHTPLRYAWERGYMKTLPHVPYILKLLAPPIAAYFRSWDKKTANKIDCLIANSEYIQAKIKKYYERDAEVIYPPVDETHFYRTQEKNKNGKYYLMAGRLVHYKRFDLGIAACNALGRNLKVVGVGLERAALKKSADHTHTEFVPFKKDGPLRTLYQNARALIFPQIEDFGLVAAEAQMCGLPVIAYGEGGGKEIVEDGKTGIIFHEQTKTSLMQAIRRFEAMHFDRAYIAERAKRFSERTFRDRMIEIVTRTAHEERELTR